MVDLGGGCGLRQGEILGVAVNVIDFESDTLHVVQQLKLSHSKAVFAPPKGGKLRDVLLPGPVADVLREALAEHLGHSDPGLTLRVCAHHMPSSQERTRKAVAAVFMLLGFL